MCVLLRSDREGRLRNVAVERREAFEAGLSEPPEYGVHVCIVDFGVHISCACVLLEQFSILVGRIRELTGFVRVLAAKYSYRSCNRHSSRFIGNNSV